MNNMPCRGKKLQILGININGHYKKKMKENNKKSRLEVKEYFQNATSAAEISSNDKKPERSF